MTTRFAPSPTGHLHLGHAYAALVAFHHARQPDGRFLLRWEDIDRSRCRLEYETAIRNDLEWLGLEPDGLPIRQSERMKSYGQALDQLRALNLLYPCFCTRREIREEIERMDGAPHGPEGPHYPGRCRNLSEEEQKLRIEEGGSYVLRLNMKKAVRHTGPLTWEDLKAGTQTARPETLGDVVLARKDVPTSYHLAVTLDDAFEGISLVTRGEDLFPATHVHRLLQELLDLPQPRWLHHPVVLDQHGVRMAKRREGETLSDWRKAGRCPREVFAELENRGLPTSGIS